MPGPGKPFNKGNRAAIGKGRPEVPADIKAARKLNQTELERTVNKLLFCTPTELKAVAENPETTMLEAMVASIMAQAATKGDQMRLEFILARLIGKAPDKLEVTGSIPFIIRRPSGETVELGTKAKEIE